MQQESKSTNFIITELKYRAFKILSLFYNESLFLHSIHYEYLFILIFYIHDLFESFESF